MKIISVLDYNPDDYVNEVNNLPSLTVPDQAMSMTEILQRFARGLDSGTTQYDGYYDEDETPDFNKLDLAEKEQILAETQKTINDLQTQLQDETTNNNTGTLPASDTTANV